MPQLSTIQGVGSIQLIGNRNPIMSVTVDPVNLQAMDAEANDVATAIRQRNTDVPAGDITSASDRTSIQLGAAADPVASVAGAAVRHGSDHIIRVGDVGHVAITGEDSSTRVRIDGRSAIALGIMRQSTANSLTLAQAVRAGLPQIQAALPERHDHRRRIRHHTVDQVPRCWRSATRS